MPFTIYLFQFSVQVEEECNVTFTPVVTLTEVEVKTGEDDEDVLYTG